ncbi:MULTISPECIES: MlaD family protein [Mycobacterium avium complex (MAC)]|uniref:Mce family protein n=1 Tax=Mycobacterium paraintracellulare TaxID=1138383 RepID=A0ABN6AU01_9MYCO|nr:MULTISPECIES: MlaD family protein [Mycobacterium avium complex (MAC)]MEE3754946.1 MlaD family protein [Mycobacterium intracellulare]OSC23318.1 MCE family protein [Mycobacterium paraintracellulare]BBY71367.1 putative Mce family protein [Mycobacterium paraintracellulare]
MKPLAATWRIGVALALAVVLFILLANTLTNPVAVDTRAYTADFTDASGLHPDGDVRVRGVRVGKVKSVDLARINGQNVARVQMTLDQKYGVVGITRLAIKFQALTGVRYIDVTNPAEGYRTGDVVTQIPTSMTQPSFDVTALFNGLQPVLATLSPEEINTFTANAASFLTGDGSGLKPLLDSIRRLTEFVSERQQVVATLIQNLSNISKGIGGTSDKFIHLVDLANQPIDGALTILDEFRKDLVYSKDFFDPTIRLLHNAGFRNGVNIDEAFDRAFSNLDNFFDAFKLVPVINENIPPPGNEGTEIEPCSRGNFQLPETMDVLLNGQRVVLCNR